MKMTKTRTGDKMQLGQLEEPAGGLVLFGLTLLLSR